MRYPDTLTVTWDSEGALDASARVVVPESGEAQAEVGLSGDVSADLRVSTADGAPATGAVELVWAGPDGVFGTADDVRIPATAVDGRVRASGLPAGSYRLVGRGGAEISAPVTLTGASGVLSVALMDGERRPALAATGSPVSTTLAAGVWLVLAGLVLARAARAPRVRRAA